jgi:hypothetical protein
VFIVFGFLGHPNALWEDWFRLICGQRPPLAKVVATTMTFGMVAWFLGATVETTLVAVGMRLTRPPDQSADNDDGGPPNC